VIIADAIPPWALAEENWPPIRVGFGVMSEDSRVLSILGYFKAISWVLGL